MNIRFFTLVTFVLLVVGLVGLWGCERMTDMMKPDAPMIATEDTIKIGLIQPTGSYESFAKGAELAQAEINAAGGVMDKQIEFVRRDNAAMDTTAIVEELQDMGVSAILGPIFSSNTLPLRSIVQVPLLPAANSRAITEENDFIFIPGAANDLQAKSIAAAATNLLGAKTAATIGLGEDAYSMIITDEFQKAFMALGGEVAAAETYASGDTDFTAQLTAIQEANPDVVFFASWPPAVPLAMKQAREMGITATFIGGDGWDEETLLTTLDDNAPLEGGYYTANFSAQIPGEKAQAFVAAYRAAQGRDPGGITAVGYDSTYLLAQAIEAANATDPTMIRDALAAITNYSGATEISHFENQIAVKELVINTIKDGKIMHVSAEDILQMQAAGQDVTTADGDASQTDDTSDADTSAEDTDAGMPQADEAQEQEETTDGTSPADDASAGDTSDASSDETPETGATGDDAPAIPDEAPLENSEPSGDEVQ